MPVTVTPLATSNTSTPVGVQDYGVKMAKAGFDVLTAPEQESLYNSSWPSLQIAKVLDVSDLSTPIAHGMPFVPFAVLMGTFETYYGSGGLFNTFVPLSVDETQAYPNRISFSLTPREAKVVVYNLDITVDVDYPYKERGGTATTYDSDYGLKVVKEGEDIESTDLRKFSVHSRCQSPMVLAVKTQETVSAANTTSSLRTIQYRTGLEFVSYAFGYARFIDTGIYVYAPYIAQSFPVTTSDGFTSRLALPTSEVDKGSIVVLRSPMFSETNEYAVTY